MVRGTESDLELELNRTVQSHKLDTHVVARNFH